MESKLRSNNKMKTCTTYRGITDVRETDKLSNRQISKYTHPAVAQNRTASKDTKSRSNAECTQTHLHRITHTHKLTASKQQLRFSRYSENTFKRALE